MAMKTPQTYAAAIVGSNAAALQYMTNLVTQIQAMIKDGDVVPTALVAPAGTQGGPVTGTGKVE